MAAFKKILGYVKNIIATVIIAFCCFYFSFNLVSPRNTVRYLGFKFYTVTSSSMSPYIDKGDIVLVTKVSYDDLQVGDVVAANVREGQDVLHFVAEKKPSNQFKTKKANVFDKKDYDFWTLTDKDILGKGILVLPKIGHLFLFLKSIFGKLLLISLLSIWGIIHITKKNNDKNSLR